jgi:hypothetical protein
MKFFQIRSSEPHMIAEAIRLLALVTFLRLSSVAGKEGHSQELSGVKMPF